jgi:hypothetical protein
MGGAGAFRGEQDARAAAARWRGALQSLATPGGVVAGGSHKGAIPHTAACLLQQAAVARKSRRWATQNPKAQLFCLGLPVGVGTFRLAET